MTDHYFIHAWIYSFDHLCGYDILWLRFGSFGPRRFDTLLFQTSCWRGIGVVQRPASPLTLNSSLSLSDALHIYSTYTLYTWDALLGFVMMPSMRCAPQGCWSRTTKATAACSVATARRRVRPFAEPLWCNTYRARSRETVYIKPATYIGKEVGNKRLLMRPARGATASVDFLLFFSHSVLSVINGGKLGSSFVSLSVASLLTWLRLSKSREVADDKYQGDLIGNTQCCQTRSDVLLAKVIFDLWRDPHTSLRQK